VPITYGSITDARDNQVYRTLTVEGMTWMQQDLNFQAPGSICPDTVSECKLRLYSWSTAIGVDSQFDTTLLEPSSEFRQGVCPAGWHLPTVAEWLELQKIMSLPGISGDWASRDGFDLKGWWQSGTETLGWYWIADETGPGTARIAKFQISYPMLGPSGLMFIEQVDPAPKKFKLGIRCLLDGVSE
jgi:uncharacterized protein (TIGR02145 family)